MDDLINILVQGTLTSAVLALVAVGFSLVYGVGGTVNLAHGSFFMIGAYAAFATSRAGAPLLVAAIAGVGTALLAGVLLDRLVIAPIRHQEVPLLIATLAVAVLVESVIRLVFGAANQRLPAFVDGTVSILGVRVESVRVLAFAVAVAALGVVLFVLVRTPVGRVVRAVSQDPEAALLMGIRTDRVDRGVLALGAGLAGLAGVMVAPITVLEPKMWLLPLTQAFAIVILGGLGSIAGTILAAVVVGFLDRTVAITLQDGAIKVGLVTIAVILVTLILRPQGLLGRRPTAA